MKYKVAVVGRLSDFSYVNEVGPTNPLCQLYNTWYNTVGSAPAVKPQNSPVARHLNSLLAVSEFLV